MIERRRLPGGRNLDVDHGPGPVGSCRGTMQRAIGAVQLRDAIAPATRALDTPMSPARKASKRAFHARRAEQRA